jgi:2-polyprenyl-3-methyl-5-hydroxy-6-metoxy-1,4-benzoquinol methylase
LKKFEDGRQFNNDYNKTMKNEQNEFYSSISKFYSSIFPYNPAQLNFVKNKAGQLEGKHILDIGCAAGELAFHLAESGAKVTGIDINDDLLQQAGANNIHPNCSFQLGNMLDLKKDFEPQQFDLVLCFGNTLVHLLSTEHMETMLQGVWSVLKPGGHFLLQILNYDFILEERVDELPLIENGNIRFVRRYKFEEGSQRIRFNTTLEMKKENQKVSNETTLLALKSKPLESLLQLAGFKEIQFYSNFKQDPFGGKHLPLVVSCEK